MAYHSVGGLKFFRVFTKTKTQEGKPQRPREPNRPRSGTENHKDLKTETQEGKPQRPREPNRPRPGTENHKDPKTETLE
jgi:hypothetical protein